MSPLTASLTNTDPVSTSSTMTFQDAEKNFQELRSQWTSGKLNDAEFEMQVNQLKVQDTRGLWWQIGVRSGEWYFFDGQKWVKADPKSGSPISITPFSILISSLLAIVFAFLGTYAGVLIKKFSERTQASKA